MSVTMWIGMASTGNEGLEEVYGELGRGSDEGNGPPRGMKVVNREGECMHL